MPRTRTLRGTALPVALALSSLAADCSGGSGIDCDPATTLPLTVGVKVSDAIDTKHCISGDDPGDLFTLTLTQQTVARFTATSTRFRPEITIARPSATPSIEDEVLFVAGSPAQAVAILPAGQYVVDIQSSDNAVGAYELTSEVVGLNACYDTNGVFTFMTTGQTLNSEITTADCAPAEAPAARYELYGVYLRAGRAYTFTATTAINSFNFSLAKDRTNVAGGVITTNGNATFTYTPTSSGYYVVGFAPLGTRTGPFTLSVSP